MVDTFLANADPEELRGIVRNLLASSPPSVSARLATIARTRLKHKLSARGSTAIPASSSPLFLTSKDGSSPRPADPFYHTLRAARSMYGVGLGFMALRHLTPAMQQTIGLRWEDDDEMADSLAILDADMTQAIQSGKEELLREKGASVNEARAVVKELRLRLSEALASVRSWGGEFPFERTQASLEHWKL
ncbi:hypothetical protein BJ322DRAFT_1040958 [Thelephora terrestris]|uniref:Uncharacterized protein n=1 Tax=Thelephora terrestris TaxID=56493 RepID=A0A9P6LBL4_9AGAM|nr:hypothetical protein BJ322DRAFT_1040958 [Thelephora terrestris]